MLWLKYLQKVTCRVKISLGSQTSYNAITHITSKGESEKKKRGAGGGGKDSFISLCHSVVNCKRVSTVDTSAQTDYPEGLEKKGLNIKCLNMCSAFQTVQLPLSLVKAMKLLNVLKKSACCFSC